MLMKVKTVDFHAVQPEHAVMHARLANWASWVAVRGTHWMGPIWKMGKSNGRQWDIPELRAPIDTLDAVEVEKAVSKLPDKHRTAVRWAYVYKDAPIKRCRELAVSMEGLDGLVRAGRTMLINRGREIK